MGSQSRSEAIWKYCCENIDTAKALVRNLSKKSNVEAEILLRNFMLERFLERIAIADYKHNFILKGGMLIAAMVGIAAHWTLPCLWRWRFSLRFLCPVGKIIPSFARKHLGAPAARLPICRYSRFVSGLFFYSVYKVPRRKSQSFINPDILRTVVWAPLKKFFKEFLDAL